MVSEDRAKSKEQDKEQDKEQEQQQQHKNSSSTRTAAAQQQHMLANLAQQSWKIFATRRVILAAISCWKRLGCD